MLLANVSFPFVVSSPVVSVSVVSVAVVSESSGVASGVYLTPIELHIASATATAPVAEVKVVTEEAVVEPAAEAVVEPAAEAEAEAGTPVETTEPKAEEEAVAATPNGKILMKQLNTNLSIYDVKTKTIMIIEDFSAPSAFIFLYINRLFLTFRGTRVSAWNFQGTQATKFVDHELWSPTSIAQMLYDQYAN